MKGPTTVFTHKGLSPHQFTPMSGAHKALEATAVAGFSEFSALFAVIGIPRRASAFPLGSNAARTKTKLLLVSGPLVLFIAFMAAVLCRPSPPDFAVHVVGRTNDALGQVHVFYELTNMKARERSLVLAEVEAKTETGWQRASNSKLQQERGKSRFVYAASNAVIHIVAPPEGTAVRGEVQYAKRNFIDKIRWQFYRWGFPTDFRAGSVLGEEYSTLPLPEVQKSGDPFLIIPVATLEAETYRERRAAAPPMVGYKNAK
jgi:hypothetical protein